MIWKPRRSVGGLVGITLILLVLAIDGVLLSRLMGSPVSFTSFALALAIAASPPLLIFLAYRTYGFFSLRYRLDRNCLIITWADVEHVIPLGSITRIVEGGAIEAEGMKSRNPRISAVMRWPGYWIGRGEIEGMGPILFYATRPPAQQLLVVTPDLAYGISPVAPEEFIAAFGARRRLGPIRSLAQKTYRARFRSWPFWSDKSALLLTALSLLANLALFAYICWRYPALPKLLPLHWDALGHVDRIATKNQLFSLPIIGLITLLTNYSLGFTVHGRERLGTYSLLGGAMGVQVLLWLAVLNITS